jgi:hypothetical protein
MNQAYIAPRQRIKKLRKFKAQKERQARVRALLKRIGHAGKREVFREGRMLARRHARNQIRKILPLYY